MSPDNLALTEQETHLNMTADDRGTWYVFSDDPVMQRRLEKIGAVITKVMKDGVGKEYTLKASQVSLRKEMSAEKKAALAARLQRKEE